MKLELDLTPTLEEALSARARANSRSVEEEARLLLQRSLKLNVADKLELLNDLDDAELWRLASRQVSTDDSERVQDLIDRYKTVGLAPGEAEELERLRRYGQSVMLLRAEAAALLKARGHDVNPLRKQL